MLDRRYEKEMSKKERRQFEKEKLKQMNRKEKLEYLWMYYKIWLLVPILLLVGIYLGVCVYRGLTAEVLLQVVVVDSGLDDYDELGDQFKEYIGADKSNQTVTFNSNLNTATYQGEMAFTALLTGESIDLVICNEEFYQQEGQDILEKCAELDPDSAYVQKLGVAYEPVYLCVAVNAPNRENAQRFIEMLQSE